jgi:hypothetical protein
VRREGERVRESECDEGDAVVLLQGMSGTVETRRRKEERWGMMG